MIGLALKAFASGAWALVRRVPWQAWLALVLLVAVGLYGRHEYARGFDASSARHRAHEAALIKRVAEERVRSAIATERVVTNVQWRTRVVRERGATIVKEVPVYVPLDSCALPGGFRVLHDAAAAGVLPDPAGIATAAPVPAQVAAITIADNYTTCEENDEALLGLLAFGCANGWPVNPSVCAELAMRSKPTAADEPR